MAPLLSQFDYVSLIMMGLAAILLLVSIIILWPDLMRERAVDVEETRRLHAQLAEMEADRERGHGHTH
jgi:ABC-type nickel/cobalt efflux system permease component RcnA